MPEGRRAARPDSQAAHRWPSTPASRTTPGRATPTRFAESVRHSGRLNELTLMPKSVGFFNIFGQLKTLPSAFNMVARRQAAAAHPQDDSGSQSHQNNLRTRWRTVQVKVAFYPGCVSKGACPELYVSAKAIAEPLGTRTARARPKRRAPAPACSASRIRELADALNGLTLAMAEAAGRRFDDDLQHLPGRALEHNYTLERDEVSGARRPTRRSPTRASATKARAKVKHLLVDALRRYRHRSVAAAIKRKLTG